MPITDDWRTLEGSDTAGYKVWRGTLGNGTAIARCRRARGELQIIVQLKAGSTTDFAAGAPSVFEIPPALLPPLMAPTSTPFQAGASNYLQVGALPGWAYDASTGSTYPVIGRCYVVAEVQSNTSLAVEIQVYSTAGTAISSTVPFTWAVGDILMLGNALEAFDN